MLLCADKKGFITTSKLGLLLALLFFLFHLIGLTRHSFWTDELITYGTATLPVEELIKNRLKGGYSPFYFIFIKYWGRLLGYSEWTMRFPSVVFATLSFLSFFFLSKKFITDKRIFIIAITLFFFHPFVFWASQEARMYSLLLFISILSSYIYLLFINDGKTYHLVIYSLTVLFGINSHVLFFLQIIVHTVYLLIYHRRLWFKFFLGISAPLLVLLPVFLFYTSMIDKQILGMKLSIVNPGVPLKRMAYIAMGDPNISLLNCESLKTVINVFIFSFFIIFVLSSIIYFNKLIKTSIPPAQKQISHHSFDFCYNEFQLLRFSFYWAGIPVLLIYLFAVLIYNRIGFTRYYIITLPPIIIIIAIGYIGLKKNLLSNMVRFLFVITFLTILILQLIWRGPGVREAVNFLKENYREKDGVIFCGDGSLRHSFSLYDGENIVRVGISRDFKSKKLLLVKVEEFTKGKERVWVMLYRDNESPLNSLLKEYPKIFRNFFEQKIREVKIQGFEVMR